MQDDLIIEKCLKERGVNVRVIRAHAMTTALEKELQRELDAQMPFDIVVQDEKVIICRHHSIGLHDPDSLDKIAKIIKHCSRGPDIVGVGKGMSKMSHCEKCKKL